MADPPQPLATYEIDSDEDTPSTMLASHPEEEAERQAQILSSYKDYLNEIQEELPTPTQANADTEEARPMDPEEETIGDGGTLDPPAEEYAPLRGPFRRFRENRRQRRRNRNQAAYHESDDELDEMYQELGVAPPLVTRRSYTHPFLQCSKRCILITVITLSILLGLIIGLTRPSLGGMNVKTDGSEVLTEAQRESEEYQKVAELYQPNWYDREDGWEGQSYDEGILFCATLGNILCPYEAYCPLGKGTTPLGGGKNVPQSWAPLIDNEDGWVQIGLSNQCNRWDDLYTQPPAWGETGAGSEIITKHIMCCTPHHVDSQQRPGWAANTDTASMESSSSSSSSSITKEPVDSNWEQTIYENIPGAKYAVGWYSRSNGYDGETMTDALKFCARQKTILCPFESICPDGPENPPVGGSKIPPDGGVAWVPVLDMEFSNEWVAVSHPDVCIKYTNMHENPPSWGDHGGNEPETRNVACCKAAGIVASDNDTVEETKPEIVVIGTPRPTPKPTSEPTDPPTAKVVTEAPVEEATPTPTVTEFTAVITAVSPSPTPSAEGKSMEMLYTTIGKIHEPAWFNRSSGWTGKSWGEAKEFCASLIGEGNTFMKLCDLGVYCPIPNGTPMGGVKDSPADDDRGAWSPFGNMENGWVRVDDTQSCTVYNSMYGNAPEWGMSGEGAEDITQNIQCCKTTLTSSTPEPTKAPVETEVAAPTDTTTESTASNNEAAPSDNEESNPVSSPVAPPSANVNTEKPTNDRLVASTFTKNEAKYAPKWFDRSIWKGTSYTDAIEFCARRGWVLCPYEAYCPLGPGAHLYDGVKSAADSWSPLIDVPNGWVQVGSVDTCELYNAVHPHPPVWGFDGKGSEKFTENIMCCDGGFTTVAESLDMANKPEIYDTPTVKEMDVLYNFHPMWLQRKHGYAGTTHEESMDFCQYVSPNMELCPLIAYCPNGETNSLYYGREPFSGEQWAPISTDDGSEDWVQIGTVDEVSTCTTYSSNFGNTAPWESDGKSEEKKQHVLCCQKKTMITNPTTHEEESMEDVMADALRPIWYDDTHGWNGGSHNDAQLFCSAIDKKELCPYVAICPNGKGYAPMAGHKVDFTEEGEQWAPIGGLNNHWVMIGQMYENLATRCMSYSELTGNEDGPDWGVTSENVPDKKKHILCCDKTS